MTADLPVIAQTLPGCPICGGCGELTAAQRRYYRNAPLNSKCPTCSGGFVNVNAAGGFTIPPIPMIIPVELVAAS